MAEQDINLRSEQVQEILEKMPHWTIRYGNFIMLLVSLALIGLSYYIKYPETIQTNFVIKQNEQGILTATGTIFKQVSNIKNGQTLYISLDNYPNEKYQTMEGKISSVYFPSEQSTQVTVVITENMKNELEVLKNTDQHLNGKAKIVTGEYRLIEKIFEKFSKSFHK